MNLFIPRIQHCCCVERVKHCILAQVTGSWWFRFKDPRGVLFPLILVHICPLSNEVSNFMPAPGPVAASLPSLDPPSWHV